MHNNVTETKALTYIFPLIVLVYVYLPTYKTLSSLSLQPRTVVCGRHLRPPW